MIKEFLIYYIAGISVSFLNVVSFVVVFIKRSKSNIKRVVVPPLFLPVLLVIQYFLEQTPDMHGYAGLAFFLLCGFIGYPVLAFLLGMQVKMKWNNLPGIIKALVTINFLFYGLVFFGIFFRAC